MANMMNRFETNKEFYLRNTFILLKIYRNRRLSICITDNDLKILKSSSAPSAEDFNMTKLMMSGRRKVMINIYGNFL